jgi:ribosomal-protein-alanine N-acetyltransferase
VIPRRVQENAHLFEAYRIATIGAGCGSACARVHAASFDAAWDAADLEQFLGAGETVAHGVIESADDSVVGFVLSRTASDEAEILTLAVAPAHRRRGLARRLLCDHLESLAEAGAKLLFLEVGTENGAARALYASLGCTPVGERKGYYRSGRADALVLRLDLPRNGSS